MATPNASPRLWVGIAQSCEVAPEALAGMATCLGPHDSQRFCTFGSERRRREFLFGRWILSQSWRPWLRGAPPGLAFDSTPDGAVRIVDRGNPTRFGASLSHAGGWAACALFDGGASGVGIDIEPMRERDYPAMDETAFPSGEHIPLHLLPIETHRDEFYLRWTRHEARLKATGGMSCPYPCHEQSYVVHGSLMLSLCIVGQATIPGPIQVLEWNRNSGFRACASAQPVSLRTF